MSNLAILLIIEVIILLIPAVFIFKSVKNYFECFFSFLFAGYFVSGKNVGIYTMKGK